VVGVDLGTLRGRAVVLRVAGHHPDVRAAAALRPTSCTACTAAV
jgi:hypothetical protein